MSDEISIMVLEVFCHLIARMVQEATCTALVAAAVLIIFAVICTKDPGTAIATVECHDSDFVAVDSEEIEG